MDLDYKGIHIHSFYDFPDFWTRPIDWLEHEGMLTPVQVSIHFPTLLRPKRFGLFRRRTKEIIVYRNHDEMDVTLVHELVHAWQHTSGYLDAFTLPQSREEYLLLPHEAEANWWSNEYHLDIYGTPMKIWEEYEERGFSLF